MVQSVNQPTLCISVILSISFILHMRRSRSNVNACAFKKPHQFKLFGECLTSQMFAKVLIRFTFALYALLSLKNDTLD